MPCPENCEEFEQFLCCVHVDGCSIDSFVHIDCQEYEENGTCDDLLELIVTCKLEEAEPTITNFREFRHKRCSEKDKRGCLHLQKMLLRILSTDIEYDEIQNEESQNIEESFYDTEVNSNEILDNACNIDVNSDKIIGMRKTSVDALPITDYQMVGNGESLLSLIGNCMSTGTKPTKEQLSSFLHTVCNEMGCSHLQELFDILILSETGGYEEVILQKIIVQPDQIVQSKTESNLEVKVDLDNTDVQKLANLAESQLNIGFEKGNVNVGNADDDVQIAEHLPPRIQKRAEECCPMFCNEYKEVCSCPHVDYISLSDFKHDCKDFEFDWKCDHLRELLKDITKEKILIEKAMDKLDSFVHNCKYYKKNGSCNHLKDIASIARERSKQCEIIDTLSIVEENCPIVCNDFSKFSTCKHLDMVSLDDFRHLDCVSFEKNGDCSHLHEDMDEITNSDTPFIRKELRDILSEFEHIDCEDDDQSTFCDHLTFLALKGITRKQKTKSKVKQSENVTSKEILVDDVKEEITLENQKDLSKNMIEYKEAKLNALKEKTDIEKTETVTFDEMMIFSSNEKSPENVDSIDSSSTNLIESKQLISKLGTFDKHAIVENLELVTGKDEETTSVEKEPISFTQNDSTEEIKVIQLNIGQSSAGEIEVNDINCDSESSSFVVKIGEKGANRNQELQVNQREPVVQSKSYVQSCEQLLLATINRRLVNMSEIPYEIGNMNMKQFCAELCSDFHTYLTCPHVDFYSLDDFIFREPKVDDEVTNEVECVSTNNENAPYSETYNKVSSCAGKKDINGISDCDVSEISIDTSSVGTNSDQEVYQVVSNDATTIAVDKSSIAANSDRDVNGEKGAISSGDSATKPADLNAFGNASDTVMQECSDAFMQETDCEKLSSNQDATAVITAANSEKEVNDKAVLGTSPTGVLEQNSRCVEYEAITKQMILHVENDNLHHESSELSTSKDAADAGTIKSQVDTATEEVKVPDTNALVNENTTYLTNDNEPIRIDILETSEKSVGSMREKDNIRETSKDSVSAIRIKDQDLTSIKAERSEKKQKETSLNSTSPQEGEVEALVDQTDLTWTKDIIAEHDASKKEIESAPRVVILPVKKIEDTKIVEDQDLNVATIEVHTIGDSEVSNALSIIEQDTTGVTTDATPTELSKKGEVNEAEKKGAIATDAKTNTEVKKGEHDVEKTNVIGDKNMVSLRSLVKDILDQNISVDESLQRVKNFFLGSCTEVQCGKQCKHLMDLISSAKTRKKPRKSNDIEPCNITDSERISESKQMSQTADKDISLRMLFVRALVEGYSSNTHESIKNIIGEYTHSECALNQNQGTCGRIMEILEDASKRVNELKKTLGKKHERFDEWYHNSCTEYSKGEVCRHMIGAVDAELHDSIDGKNFYEFIANWCPEYDGFEFLRRKYPRDYDYFFHEDCDDYSKYRTCIHIDELQLYYFEHECCLDYERKGRCHHLKKLVLGIMNKEDVQTQKQIQTYFNTNLASRLSLFPHKGCPDVKEKGRCNHFLELLKDWKKKYDKDFKMIDYHDYAYHPMYHTNCHDFKADGKCAHTEDAALMPYVQFDSIKCAKLRDCILHWRTLHRVDYNGDLRFRWYLSRHYNQKDVVSNPYHTWKKYNNDKDDCDYTFSNIQNYFFTTYRHLKENKNLNNKHPTNRYDAFSTPRAREFDYKSWDGSTRILEMRARLSSLYGKQREMQDSYRRMNTDYNLYHTVNKANYMKYYCKYPELMDDH